MATDIIGLAGYARSGKDTVAGMLKRRGYTRFAFADALKAVALAADPLVETTTPGGSALIVATPLTLVVSKLGWERAKKHPDVRRFLQDLGVAVRTHVHEGVWVDTVMRQVDGHDGGAVITDVRFPNEVDAILEQGGTVYRVTRPSVEPVNSHVSETALGDVELPTIANVGTLSQLERVVADLFGPVRPARRQPVHLGQ